MSEMCYRCMTAGSVVNGVCQKCGASRITRSKADLDLLPLGVTIDHGRITIGDKLGRGGFGITYIARDTEFGLIALKEYFPKHLAARDSENNIIAFDEKRDRYDKYLRDFRREARLLYALGQSPNIVHVMFTLEENNTVYYGMELLQGQPLDKWFRNLGRPMTPMEVYQILTPIMDALTYAHSMKTYHRDISPDNIFLRRSNDSYMGISPCLIDFGAAYTAMSDFTQTCPSVKKGGFSPPDQNYGIQEQGSFTDVYALCATIYYLLTMKIPMPATDRTIRQEKLRPPSEIVKDIPKSLDKIILKGMAMSRKDRTQTIDEVKTQLHNVLMPGEKLTESQYTVASVTPASNDHRHPKSNAADEAQNSFVWQGNSNPASSVQSNSSVSGNKSQIVYSVSHVESKQTLRQKKKVMNPSSVSSIVYSHSASTDGHSSDPGLRILSCFLEWVILYGFSLIAPFTLSYMPIWPFILCGFVLSVLLNTVIGYNYPYATLGQHIVGTCYTADEDELNVSQRLLYSILRSLPPFILVDELITAVLQRSCCYTESVCRLHVETRSINRNSSNVSDVVVSEPIYEYARQSDKEYSVHYNPNSSSSYTPDVKKPRTNRSAHPEKSTYGIFCVKGALKGKYYPLNGFVCIGRDPTVANVILPSSDTTASRKHCRIIQNNGQWYLQDMKAHHGTYLNRRRLTDGGVSEPLRTGDIITVGTEEFEFWKK